MHDHPFPDRRRARVLAMLSLATLLLHGAVVSGLPWAWNAPDAVPVASAAATLQVRVVDEAVAPGPSAGGAEVEAISPSPSLPSAPTRERPRTLLKTIAQALPAAPSRAPTLIEPLAAAPTPRVLALDIERPTVDARDAAEQASVGDRNDSNSNSNNNDTNSNSSNSDASAAPLPHYRTQPPPAVTLQYELQRGFLRGTGELAWRPEPGRYELRLTGKVGSLAALTQVSTGGFDAAGLAPLRFTDQRLSRAPTAANFQREAGKITFSGPSTEYALVPGAQDRLSWMIELAAIVAAEPGVRAANATVAMFVVGARGEGGVWTFRSIGPEALDTPGGSVAAVKFVREPRDEHDTQVHVWLDPRRHWLPVRARQQSGAGDDAFELRLQSGAAP